MEVLINWVIVISTVRRDPELQSPKQVLRYEISHYVRVVLHGCSVESDSHLRVSFAG